MNAIKFSNVFLVNSENEILILRRTVEHPTKPLALDLPGGGLELGEDFAQAAIRELKEETGLDIKLGDLELIRHRKHNLPTRSIEGAIYISKMPLTNAFIKLSSEHDAYYWVNPHNLKNLPEFHHESLNFALKNKFLS